MAGGISSSMGLGSFGDSVSRGTWLTQGWSATFLNPTIGASWGGGGSLRVPYVAYIILYYAILSYLV